VVQEGLTNALLGASARPRAPTGAGDPAALADWWKTLNDPTLNQLIDQALARNKTAKEA